MINQLYSDHISHLQAIYEEALGQPGLDAVDAVLIHSGSEQVYYGDDRHIPFQAFGHFCHWLPINRPNQFVLIRPGRKPCYLQVIPRDFWHDQSIANADWWQDEWDLIQLDTVAQLPQHLTGNTLLLGEPGSEALVPGLLSDEDRVRKLQYFLDYQRAYKTAYEIAKLQEAVDRALLGHEAARQAFLDNKSEFDIHMAYLQACRSQENETPYTNIVAVNEKAAVLHYQQKRLTACDPQQVLLIDAGYRHNNYGSDITRTTTTDSAHPVFQQLLQEMEKLELALVSEIVPGLAYPELHERALKGIGKILLALDICRGDEADLWALNIPQLFMPHGLGHLLGIQVHDVGGHQQDNLGSLQSPPAHSPALRNTREIGEHMVFTIEPGCYFIPMLLEPERQSRRGEYINWQVLEQLYPCGGIRIEDNIQVTASGSINLSRPAIAGE